jgi:excisionase family DNA binding protein
MLLYAYRGEPMDTHRLPKMSRDKAVSRVKPMEPIEPKSFYTAEDAARLLGVKSDTVKAYLRDGSLKGLKVGPKRQWKVSGSELIRKQKEWNLA